MEIYKSDECLYLKLYSTSDFSVGILYSLGRGAYLMRKKKNNDTMAGRWNVGIEISITKPYTYSQSPKCVKGKMFSVYNSWDSRNININFCQWEYEYFTIEETI